jgi:hypothetical protein
MKTALTDEIQWKGAQHEKVILFHQSKRPQAFHLRQPDDYSKSSALN